MKPLRSQRLGEEQEKWYKSKTTVAGVLMFHIKEEEGEGGEECQNLT